MTRVVMKFGGTSMAGIERIRHVAERALAGDQSLKAAPVHAPRRRLDETLAARKPVVAWKQPAPDGADRPTPSPVGDR